MVGVLTQAFPRSLVDEVLAETARVQQRNWLLPVRPVVHFVLAMCLFSGQRHEEVTRLLTAGLQGARRSRGSWVVPSTTAIWRATTRLGWRRCGNCSCGCAVRSPHQARFSCRSVPVLASKARL